MSMFDAPFEKKKKKERKQEDSFRNIDKHCILVPEVATFASSSPSITFYTFVTGTRHGILVASFAPTSLNLKCDETATRDYKEAMMQQKDIGSDGGMMTVDDLEKHLLCV